MALVTKTVRIMGMSVRISFPAEGIFSLNVASFCEGGLVQLFARLDTYKLTEEVNSFVTMVMR